MRWIDVKDRLPKEKKFVLWQFDENTKNGKPSAIVVGYLRYAGGDTNCPQVIAPGCHPGTLPRYWSDCLGEDFSPPLWNINKIKLN